MPQKTYHCATPNSRIYKKDGTSVSFVGNYLVTEDEEVQGELDAVCGKSNISHADEEAMNLTNTADAMLEVKVTAEQMTAAATAQAGVAGEIAKAANIPVAKVDVAAVQADAAKIAADLLASRK